MEKDNKKETLEIEKGHYNLLLKECDKSEIAKINDDFLAVYTYDSVGLEGNNKIPFEEVKKLIKYSDILEYGKKDKKEVLNHYQAYKYILRLVENKVNLTEDILKDLHEILLNDLGVSGIYRNVNIQIPGAKHQPPDYIKVYDRMSKLFSELANYKGNSIEKAVYAHAGISKIHPFLDGNGRLARLVMNYYLLLNGYLAISVSLSLRDEYLEKLETFKTDKNMTDLTDFVLRLLINRYTAVNSLLEIK